MSFDLFKANPTFKVPEKRTKKTAEAFPVAAPLTFYTPQPRLIKPIPSAFNSTGIISKKNKTKPTPAKMYAIVI